MALCSLVILRTLMGATCGRWPAALGATAATVGVTAALAEGVDFAEFSDASGLVVAGYPGWPAGGHARVAAGSQVLKGCHFGAGA